MRARRVVLVRVPEEQIQPLVRAIRRDFGEPIRAADIGRIIEGARLLHAAGVDAATTSQSEADEKRGREMREADEKRAKEARKLEERCRKGKPLPGDACPAG